MFQARESPFYLISSRIINKLIYFSYGTKDVLERQCQNLNRKLELYMDGTKIELPDIGEPGLMVHQPHHVLIPRIGGGAEHPLLGCRGQALAARHGPQGLPPRPQYH